MKEFLLSFILGEHGQTLKDFIEEAEF